MKKFELSELTQIVKALKTQHIEWEQFGKKSFWYSKDWYKWHSDGNIYYVRVLKSYNTFVGLDISDLSANCVYEIGKYSTTTSKQITQYVNQLADSYNRAFIEADTIYRMIA